MFHKLSRILFALMLVSTLFVMPTLAQEDDDALTEDLLVVIRGLVEVLDDDEIVIDGVIIAPAGAFIPAMLSVGDEVIVIGYLLNDDTLKAVELIVVDEDFDECSEYGNGEGCDEDADDCVVDEDAEASEEDAEVVDCEAENDEDADEEDVVDDEEDVVDDEDASGCVPSTHPIANSIANEFDVDVAYVIDLHCQGYGFGNIIRAFLLFYEHGIGDDVESLLAQSKEGGWGAIMRESGVHPSQLAPGRVIAGQKAGERGGRPDHAGPPEDRGPGNNNGRGNGNQGNQGEGRGNGNQGEGRGNGNQGGGQGNGRGGGRP